MAEPDKKPITLKELVTSSLTQTAALAKLLIEKGPDYAIRVHREDFGGTRDVTEATEPGTAMNIGAE
jgi:hypothetical protein